MTALVLAALLAADGGFDGPIYEACQEYRDAGPAEPTMGGGYWLVPSGRFALNSCRLASCKAALEATGEPSPAVPTGYVVAGAVGLGLGLVVGVVATAYLLRR